MLIDRAEIIVRGGHGGAAMPKKLKGPDGGNGGNGGNVYVKGSSNINLLNQFSQRDLFMAGNGDMGARNNKTGKHGKDIEIMVPIGTSIYEKKSKELISEINIVGERILVCKGGNGGYWKGSTTCAGIHGEERKLLLSLRLIAYFGLIGLPNAGKSSLLNELTNAHVKVANYPFTTLEPNLGVFEGKCLADIPGLIEGASKGKGLGIAFLKHIEKVEILLHCISCETKNALKDYRTVRKELAEYNFTLTKKPEIVILTKSDLIDQDYLLDLVKKLKKVNKKIISVSIHDFKGLEKFKKLLRDN